MNYYERIKEREKQLSAYRQRQDLDKSLLYLTKYAMKDKDNRDVKDIVNVTLNRPAVFAANVISALGKCSEQIVVETEDKKLDTAYIERFQRACLAMANNRLRKQDGSFQINPFLDEQTCIRGGGAARCLFRLNEKGILVPDTALWDMRYLTYESNDEGLEYAGYHTTVTQEMIDGQKWAEGLNIKVSGKGNMLDVWDDEHEEIYLDGKQVFEQPHSYGFTPVVIGIVPLGSMLADDDYMEHRGESIFFLIRTVIPELNRLVSIMQTLNLKAVKPPIKQKKVGGGEPTPYDQVMSSGAATAMEPTEDIQTVDYGDAKRAAELAYNMFDKAMQEGSLSSVDLGTMNFQMSAVALIQVGEGRDQVFLPRLSTKALINQGLVEMITAQCLQIGGTLEIGTMGHKAKFDMGKIEGEYETVFKYYAKSPQIEMARYSMAAAAGNLIPDRAKRTEILMREDPDEDERAIRWEMAEMISPNIRAYRIARSLQGETPVLGDDYGEREAEIIAMEMGMNLKMMMSGQVGQPTPVKPEQKPQLLPGLTAAGSQSSNKQATDLQATPQAPVPTGG